MQLELSNYSDHKCPTCGACIEVPQDFIGEEGAKCPKCGHTLFVSQYLVTKVE